ncbi:MAG TPA: helix-turn-helix domain-containing protein [Acidimicrobiales bacterium]|nr:helix-turn-helix domain-containing protein [Acidimicrobiales bacterium]
MSATSGPGTLSLSEEKKELTRDRIRRAAQAMLAEHGLRATVEDIARAAGVSARTVFRHYPSHDELVAQSLTMMFDELGRPVDGLPDPLVDLRGWLEMLALSAHTRSAKVLGKAFWDIHNPGENPSPVVLRALAKRRPLRRQRTDSIAEQAWIAAGGTGTPPGTVSESFGLHFSGYATRALAVDYRKTPEGVARLTTDVLMAVLGQAVDEQRRIESNAD